MSIRFGDLPTWIASIGTVAAFAAVVYQIEIERRRRNDDDERDREVKWTPEIGQLDLDPRNWTGLMRVWSCTTRR